MSESIYELFNDRHQQRILEKAAANAVEHASKSLRDVRIAEIVELDTNWTRRERSKHIARRSSYRSNLRALQRLDGARVYCAIAPCCLPAHDVLSRCRAGGGNL